MNLSKIYLQFNDLVIDNYDMLSSADENVDFKTQTYPYSFGDGSAAIFKDETVFAAEQSISLTLRLDVSKLQCDEYDIYFEYVQHNLFRPGKLWALQGSDLLVANAFISSYGEPYTDNDSNFVINVDFTIPSGTWMLVNPLKIFLKPYSPCTFNDCMEYIQDTSCKGACNTCNTGNRQETCYKCICECEYLTEDYNYCNLKRNALVKWHERCGDSYKIMYNCIAANRVWGEESLLGERICSQAPSHTFVSGTVYSRTVKNTDQVTITIIGYSKNPIIEFNGRKIQINGTYNGILTIPPSMSAYFQSDYNCEMIYIDANNINIITGSNYGFIAHHGNNSLFIQGTDCNNTTCAYVKIDAVRI